MSRRWGSAKRCHHALKTLVTRLNTSQPTGGGPSSTRINDEQQSLVQPDESFVDGMASEEARRAKRPRVQYGTSMQSTAGMGLSNPLEVPNGSVPKMHEWTPVLQYHGPDFGFDALQPDVPGENCHFTGTFDFNSTGLFNDIGWSSFDPDLSSP